VHRLKSANRPGVFDLPTVVWIYAIGALIGVALADGPPASRLGLALLWPVGPAAFLVTLAVLAAASLIAFPLVAAIGVAVALAWFAFGRGV
jgi:hypothetical protein